MQSGAHPRAVQGGCAHKAPSRCTHQRHNCCACNDTRPTSMGFLQSTVTRHGRPNTSYLYRWSKYCDFCRGFWDRQLELSGIDLSDDFPKPLIALMSSPNPPDPGSFNAVRSSGMLGPAPGISAATRSTNPAPNTSRSARKREVKRFRQERNAPNPPRLISNQDVPNSSNTGSARSATTYDPRAPPYIPNMPRVVLPVSQNRTANQPSPSVTPGTSLARPLAGNRGIQIIPQQRDPPAPTERPQPQPQTPGPVRISVAQQNLLNLLGPGSPQRDPQQNLRYPIRQTLQDTQAHGPNLGVPGHYYYQLGGRASNGAYDYSSGMRNTDSQNENALSSWGDRYQPTVRLPQVHEQNILLSQDLKKLAEETSILLELISKSELDKKKDTRGEYGQFIDNAFENISRIRKEYRAIGTQRGEDVEIEKPAPEVDDMKTDSGCIICYSQIADAVLLPCNHLVLCILCCDKMGIKQRRIPGPRVVPCPICRTIVVDRIKIFRG